MSVKQLSVLLEHKPGEMSKVSELLGREGINIGGLTLADASDMAIVRLITDNPDKAEAVLKTAGYHVKLRDVIAVETPDHPGGLNAVLKPLAQAGINVKYFYPYLRRSGSEAVLIFRTEDNDKAEEALRGNWIRILGEEIYSL